MRRFLCSMFLTALAAVRSFAANAPVQQGVTSKQVAFAYSRPNTATCTWEISTSATYSPLVADSGPDSGTQGERWFVAGVGTPLAASTLHYWRQTCGAEVYTGTFTTLATVAADPITWVYSSGGHPQANRARMNYGPMPAMGTIVEIPCAPRCLISGLPVTRDSLLFFQLTYLNEADVVSVPGEIHMSVNR